MTHIQIVVVFNDISKYIFWIDPIDEKTKQKNKASIGRIGYLFAIIGFGKQTNAWYF